jgi:hypothetical protein
MEDFKVRLMDEAQSLWNKIMALEDFIATRDEYQEFTCKQKFTMRMQLFFMRRYYFWLCRRISIHCTAEEVEEYTNPAPVVTPEEPTAEVVVEKKPKVKRKARKNTKHE